MAQTDGLDLGTCQFDPGFVFILNEVVVVGFAVLATTLTESATGTPPLHLRLQIPLGEYNVPQPWENTSGICEQRAFIYPFPAVPHIDVGVVVTTWRTSTSKRSRDLIILLSLEKP